MKINLFFYFKDTIRKCIKTNATTVLKSIQSIESIQVKEIFLFCNHHRIFYITHITLGKSFVLKSRDYSDASKITINSLFSVIAMSKRKDDQKKRKRSVRSNEMEEGQREITAELDSGKFIF